MSWPKDLGEWGFYIGLIALVLALPLNILANFLSPKLKNWWSTRSKSKTIKRIEVLELDLREAEQQEKFTDAENQIFILIRIGARLVFLFVHGIYTALFIGCLFFYRALDRHPTLFGELSKELRVYVMGIAALIAWGIIGNMAFGYLISNRAKLWRRRTQVGQNSLKEQISKLKDKLSSMQ